MQDGGLRFISGLQRSVRFRTLPPEHWCCIESIPEDNRAEEIILQAVDDLCALKYAILRSVGGDLFNLVLTGKRRALDERCEGIRVDLLDAIYAVNGVGGAWRPVEQVGDYTVRNEGGIVRIGRTE